MHAGASSDSPSHIRLSLKTVLSTLSALSVTSALLWHYKYSKSSKVCSVILAELQRENCDGSTAMAELHRQNCNGRTATAELQRQNCCGNSTTAELVRQTWCVTLNSQLVYLSYTELPLGSVWEEVEGWAGVPLPGSYR